MHRTSAPQRDQINHVPIGRHSHPCHGHPRQRDTMWLPCGYRETPVSPLRMWPRPQRFAQSAQLGAIPLVSSRKHLHRLGDGADWVEKQRQTIRSLCLCDRPRVRIPRRVSHRCLQGCVTFIDALSRLAKSACPWPVERTFARKGADRRQPEGLMRERCHEGRRSEPG
jgi:hypothetical protein